MNPYDPSRPCPKCGNKYVTTKHYEAYGQSRMSRKCERCEYRWDEAPLDAPGYQLPHLPPPPEGS